MCGRLWRIESGIPDALRFLGRKLAATEERSLRLDAAAREVLKDKTPELIEKNVRLQAIGRLTDLPDNCQKRLHESIKRTASNNGLTLILALSYGGRDEIIDGIRSLLREVEAGHIDRAMINPEMFSKHLYTRYYPDPDLLIRTSGEMRISNFLLWQLSYTEMYVTPKLWPDFTRKDLFAAVDDFAKRQRRYGGV